MAWNTDYYWPFEGKINVPIPGDLFGADRGNGRKHAGHDLIGDKPGTGQTFYAVHGGTVVLATDNLAGWSDQVGSMIIIEDDGMQWEYQEFMSGSIKVKKGDTVKGGQAIGQMGRSGTAGTGEHLHLSMAKDFFSQSPWSLDGWYDVGLYLGIPNKVGIYNRPSTTGKVDNSLAGPQSSSSTSKTSTIMINIYNERKRDDDGW
jgi:hypothetical protein